MFPPPPKKQICANLQQKQHQQQQHLQLQTSTPKSNSIHSQNSESICKLSSKVASSGAHSSSRGPKSMSIKTEMTAKSPPQENVSPNTVHKSAPVRSDRLKGESAKEETIVENLKATVPAAFLPSGSTSKGKTTVRPSEPISSTASSSSSSSDNEDNCIEKDDNNNSKKTVNWSLSSSSTTSSSSSSSSCSPSQSPLLATPSTRCGYVNVIVSCKTDGVSAATAEDDDEQEDTVGEKWSKRAQALPSADMQADDSDASLLTLTIERIFTDSYLLEAWEKLQYIDLFLYSSVKSQDEPHLENFIPGHRILLSAYSSYIRTFVDSYPDSVKFVEQLQSFLKDVISQKQTSLTQKAELDELIEAKQLSLQALSMSSIPVIVFSVPLSDLHDLVKLMYQGEVKVNKCRLSSLQKSASKLKMSSITIVEMNKQLISDSSCDFINNEKHVTETDDDGFANCLSSPEKVANANTNTQNGSSNKKENLVKQPIQQSCDLEFINGTSQSSSKSLLNKNDSNTNELNEKNNALISKAILNENIGKINSKTIETEIEEEVETKVANLTIKQSSKHPFKRSLAAFLREHGTSPLPLTIPKRLQNMQSENHNDSVLQNATFEKPKPLIHSLSNELLPENHSLLNVPKHALLQMGQHAFPLFSRSQSLNEAHQQHQQQQQQSQLQLMQQTQAFRGALRTSQLPPAGPAVASDPQSPLISALKRRETPPMPPTPLSSGYSSASSSVLSPFNGFSSNGLLPASLLTPPIDSPAVMENHFKSLLPQSPGTKPFHFSAMSSALSANVLSAPFQFTAKNPFDTGPPAFPSPFAFSKLNTVGTGGNGGVAGNSGGQFIGFQRQFSAPANLQSSAFFSHQPHDLSPLIFDAQNALNMGASAGVLSSEVTKNGRRGRRPISNLLVAPSAPNSEPNSPDIGVMMSDLGLFSRGSGSVISGSLSERSDSPGADSKCGSGSGDTHQCGANGWKTTPGSGANCRKRCQNLYHAAKYRDRRRQRMEQLYGEKDALERAQNGHIAKINSLKVQIVNLISQRTVRHSAGAKTYHCPVCSSVFSSTDAIRAHLFSVHYPEMSQQTTSVGGTGSTATTSASSATSASVLSASTGVPSFADIVQNSDPSADIAQQICSLTKDWLLRSQVVASLEQLQNSTLQQQRQQQQADQIAKSVSEQTLKNPVPALFERSLATGSALNALPMVPFN